MFKTFFLLVVTVISAFIISSCIQAKPDLKPLVKQTNDVSLVVLKSRVLNFWDLRTDQRKNIFIYLTNVTDGKLYTNCLIYQNDLVFLPNLPKGQYKISYLGVPLNGDIFLIASFDDKPVNKDQSEVTNYDTSINMKLFGFHDVSSYNCASLDFNIDKPGIYYLGNYSISNIGVKFMNKGKSYIKKIEDQDAISEFSSFLTNDKTMWNDSKIYYSTNVFYKDEFYLN